MTPRRPWQTRLRMAPRRRPAGWQLVQDGSVVLAVSVSREKLTSLAAWLVETGSVVEVRSFAGGVAEVAL